MKSRAVLRFSLRRASSHPPSDVVERARWAASSRQGVHWGAEQNESCRNNYHQRGLLFLLSWALAPRGRQNLEDDTKHVVGLAIWKESRIQIRCQLLSKWSHTCLCQVFWVGVCEIRHAFLSHHRGCCQVMLLAPIADGFCKVNFRNAVLHGCSSFWMVLGYHHASSQSRTWYNDLTPLLTLTFFWHYNIRNVAALVKFMIFFWHCNFLLTLPQFLPLQHICRIMTHIWQCIMFIALRDSFEVAIYLFGILVYYCNMLLAFQHYLRLWDSFDITTFCHKIHLQLSFGNMFLVSDCFDIMINLASLCFCFFVFL